FRVPLRGTDVIPQGGMKPSNKHYLSFQLLADVFERRPARVRDSTGTITRLNVQVAPAVRAQTLAVFAANLLGRHGQQDLLLQRVFEKQSLTLIVANLSFSAADGNIFAPRVNALRAVDEVELFRHGVSYRFQATGTTALDLSGKLADQPDV